MATLKIKQTIYLLLGLALAAGAVASTYLMVRCAGISARYTEMIEGEIAQAQQVRVLQVDFKKQVQAWKDILLRGKDDESLAKYDKEFHTLAAKVRDSGQSLASGMKDAGAKSDLESFVAQHELLDSQYEAALGDYRASRDFAAADKAVKGKDRPPTNTLDGVVEKLTAIATALPREEAARLRREQRVFAAVLVLLWAALAAWSVVFARSLGMRLSGCVRFVQQIAEGDLAARHSDARRDELGDLTRAMGEMSDRLRAMVCEMQEMAAQLKGSAHEVSSTSQTIARASNQQRGQSTQVAAALEEMIATVREVTRNCAEAAEKAVHTGQLANESCQTVADVAGDVQVLSDEARQNAHAVQELGERSRQITQIVTLIEEIAGQTNLLALNAAIEAARAGEHGRGFAVVAGEVRRLAERTTSATKEISDAVTTIQSGTSEAVTRIEQSTGRVEKSVGIANSAAERLDVLGESANEVQRRIEQIAAAAEEQSQASAQLGESMNQIAASITASSEGAEEAARTADELVQMAERLDAQTRMFKTGNACEEAPRRMRWAA